MQRDVTIADLSNMRQKPNESVQAFIHRWRHEANKCRAHLTEDEQVDDLQKRHQAGDCIAAE